jgi:hypothetical protein
LSSISMTSKKPGEQTKSKPKKMITKLRDLPLALRMVLSAMESQETWLLRIKSSGETGKGFEWPRQINEKTAVEVSKISLK